MAEKKTLKYDVHFRISEDEMNYIQKVAKNAGLSVSAYSRYILFKQNNSIPTLPANTAISTHQISIFARGIRNEFKRIAASYKQCVDSYTTAVNLKNDEGKYVVSTATTERAIGSLQDMTLELQSSLNKVLESMKGKEIHAVAKETLPTRHEDSSPKTAPANNNELLYLNLYNMQNCEIIGTLTDDAAELSNGRIKVTVAVDYTRGNEKRTAFYVVFANKGNVFSFLKKGRRVYVSGEMIVEAKPNGAVGFNITVSAFVIRLCDNN